MGNKKYSIDPVTGKKMYNRASDTSLGKPSTVGPIDPLSGQRLGSTKGNNEPIPLGKGKGFSASKEEFGTYSFIKPDDSLGDAQDRRAIQQSNWDALGNSLLKSSVTYAGATADNTIGAMVGLLSAATGGSFFDNKWGQLIDQTNSYMQENFPVYETREQQNSIDVTSMGFLDKVLNGFAYSAASITSAMIPGLGLSRIPALARIKSIKTAADKFGRDAARVVTQSELAGSRQAYKGLDFAMRGMNSAIAESGVEARETKNELRDKFVQQRIQQKGGQHNLTAEDYADIDRLSSQAANANFATNLAVVGGSNLVTFGSILRGSSDDAFNALRKQMKGTPGKMRALTKGEKAGQVGATLLKDSGSEAAQEGAQFVSNIAAQDYYEQKFNNFKGDKIDAINSINKGIHETLGSKDGLESILIGALVGGGMTGLKSITKIKGSEKENQRVNEAIEILNSDSYKVLASKVMDQAKVDANMKVMEEAAAAGDKEAFNTAYDKMLMAEVQNQAKYGTTDILLEKLNSLKELEQEEFDQYFGLTDSKLSKDEIIDNAVKRVEEGVDIHKNIEFLFEQQNTLYDKVFNNKPKERKAVDALLKDVLFTHASAVSYLDQREGVKGKRLEELTDGAVTWDDNMGLTGKYFTLTDEQLDSYIEKVNSDGFVSALADNPKIRGEMKRMVTRSRQRGDSKTKGNANFKDRRQVLRRMFLENKDLTEKQAKIIAALEALEKDNRIRPDKKAEIESILNEMKDLAIEREVANTAFRRLADLKENDFEKGGEVDRRIAESLKQTIANVAEASKNIKDKKDKDTVQTTAQVAKSEAEKEEESLREAIDNYENPDFDTSGIDADAYDAEEQELMNITQQNIGHFQAAMRQEAPRINLKKLSESLINYYNEVSQFLGTDVQALNAIIAEINEGVDPIFYHKDEEEHFDEMLDSLINTIESLNEESNTYKAIENYYAGINSIRVTPKSEEAPQPAPADVENDPESTETEETENPDAADAKFDSNKDRDASAPLDTPTLNFASESDIAGYPDFDEHLQLLNDADFAEAGTVEVFIKYPDIPYNQRNPKNPLLIAYVKTEKGDVPIGVMPFKVHRDGSLRESTKLTRTIRKAAEKAGIGSETIDMQLTVKEKWAGDLNRGYEKGKAKGQNKEDDGKTLVDPNLLAEEPILAVALQADDSNKVYLHTNGIAVEVDENIDPKWIGHTFILLPTAKKDEDGNVIHKPAKLTTRTVKELPPKVRDQYAKDIFELLTTAQYTPDGGTSNFAAVNELIPLHFRIMNQANALQVFENGNSKELKEHFNLSSEEDLKRLKQFIQDAVVRVNYTRINKLDYNKELGESGKIKIELDPNLPIYNTRFILGEPGAEPTVVDEVVNEERTQDQEVDKEFQDFEPAENQREIADALVDPADLNVVDDGTDAFDALGINAPNEEVTGNAVIDEVIQQGIPIEDEYEEGDYNKVVNLAQRTTEDKVTSTPADLQLLTNYPKLFEAVLSILDTSAPKFKMLDSSLKRGDAESELAYLNRILPNVPAFVKESLAFIGKQGANASGLFHRSAIYLAKNLDAGTAYHEAFHAVFNLFLSESEQGAILQEAQGKFKLFDTVQKARLQALYPEASQEELENIWYEEQLAEAFRAFVNKRLTSSFSQKILDFFKRLWNVLTLYKGSDTPYMDKVFENIHRGNYGKKTMNFRYKGAPKFSYRVPGLNDYQMRNAVELVNKLFEAEITAFQKQYPNIDKLQAISALGPNNIYVRVYGKLTNIIKNRKLTTKQLDYLQPILESFVTSDRKLGQIPYLHKLYYKTDIAGIDLDSAQELRDDLVDYFETVDEEIPAWLVPSTERNGKDSLSRDLKSMIARQYSGEPTDVDDLGFPLYVSFDSLYNTLERNLSGVFEREEFFDEFKKLGLLFPAVKSLWSEMKNDKNLQARWYHHFAKGQNQYQTVLLQNKKDPMTGMKYFSSGVINNSRKNIKSETLSNIESYLEKSALVSADGTVNTTLTKSLWEAYKAEIATLTKKMNDKSIEGENFTRLYKILKQAGIKISAADLRTEAKSFPSKRKFIKEVFQSANGVKGFFQLLSEGTNPFADKGARALKSLNSVSQLIANSKLDYFQGSVTTTDGKQQYSFVVPNALHKMLAKFNSKKNKGKNAKEAVKFYRSDKSYDNSLLLKQIEDNAKTTDGALEIVVVDGLSDKRENKNVRYKSYTKKDYDVVNLNMFWNEGRGSAYYSLPEMADAPIGYYMKNERFSTEKTLDYLQNLYLFELNRMELKDKDEYYNTKEFIMFPMFNGVKADKLRDLTFVRKTLKEAYITNENSYFNEYKNKLKANGIIVEMEDGTLRSPYLPNNIGKQYESLDDLLLSYYLNHSVMLGEFLTVFAGDPAFVKPDDYGKKSTDLNKRLKELNSPQKPLDSNIVGHTFDMLVFGDDKKTTLGSEFINGVAKIKGDDYAEMLADGIEATDGFSIISLDRAVKILKATEKWTPAMEAALPAIQAGTESPTETALVFQAIKGFYFGLIKDPSGKVKPLQKKDSEYPLLPSMAKGNKTLEDILERFAGEEKYSDLDPIEGITFRSTIKKGRHKIQDLDADNPLNMAEVLNTDQVVTFNYSNFGIQQPSPQKHLNNTITFGTQFRKLIIANLTGNYEVDGESMSAAQVKDLWNKLIGDNLKADFAKLYSSITTDGELDYDKLRKILIREVEENEYGPDFIESLQPDEHGKFRLDLWNPKNSTRIEALLNSMIKNRISRQSIKGAQLINASDFVVRNNNDLKVVMGEKDGEPYIEYYEAILPAWSKDFFGKYINADGSISKEMPSELLEIVGYRIPTEGKYSMVNVRVVGFSPQAAGGHIFLPVQALKQTGMDFDIDKMYFMMPEHRTKYKLGALAAEIRQQTKLDLSEDELIRLLRTSYNDLDPADKKYKFMVEKIQERGDFVKSIEYINPNLKDASKINGKKERNNALLKLSQIILKAPQTFSELSDHNSFEILTKDLRDAITPYNGLASSTDNPILTDTQREFFAKSADASFAIGVFANHNASHSMLQYEDIKVKKAFKALGYDIGNLDNLEDPEIARNLATLIAAAVDAIKDPVFYELNINTFTSNILGTMLRLGVSMTDAVTFLNTKPVIAATDLIINQTKQSPAEVKKMINELRTNSKTTGFATLKDIDLTKTPGATSADKLLNTFQKFYDISRDVSDVVQVSKLDSNPPGTLMSNNEVIFRKVMKVEQEEGTLLGTANLFTNGSKYPAINAFYEYTYLKPTKLILDKLFPWTKPSFWRTKQLMQNHFVKDLTAKSINSLNYNLMTYIIGNTEFYQMPQEELDYLNTEFFDDLVDTRDELQSVFLDVLDIDYKAKTIKFRNLTSLSVSKTLELQDSWEKLLNEPETSKLAQDLFKFNFISHGFIFSDQSYWHLAPLKLFEDTINKKDVNNMIDSGAPFSDFVEQYVRNVKNRDKLDIPKLDAQVDIAERNEEGIKVYSQVGRQEYDPLSRRTETLYPLYIKEGDDLFKRVGSEVKDSTEVHKQYVSLPNLGTSNRLEYAYGKSLPVSAYESIDLTYQKGQAEGNAATLTHAQAYELFGEDFAGIPEQGQEDAIFATTLEEEETPQDMDAKIEKAKKISDITVETEDKNNYVNTETGEVYTRSSAYLSDKQKPAAPNELFETAKKVGINLQRLVNDFFADDLSALDTYELGKEEMLLEFVEQLQTIKDNLGDYRLVNNLTLVDEDKKVAQTINLLAYNDEEAIIYDIRTLRDNKKLAKGKIKHAKSNPSERMSLGKILLAKNYDIPVKSVAVMPVVVKYEAGSTELSELKLEPSFNVPTVDTVKDFELTKQPKKKVEPTKEEGQLQLELVTLEDIQEQVELARSTPGLSEDAQRELDKIELSKAAVDTKDKMLNEFYKKYCAGR